MKINKCFPNAKEIDVKNIMTDSRIKMEDAIFFALIGNRVDGHLFIDKAIENGAIVIVYSQEVKNKHENIEYVLVEDTKTALNDFADLFFEQPSKKLDVIGLTGTSGKTTTSFSATYLFNQITKAGYIGTLGNYYDGIMHHTYYTTPEVVTLHQTMQQMKEVGVKKVVMEVSSQGIEERRVDSIKFKQALLTNFSRDHIDYHGSIENYYLAKEKLFKAIDENGTVMLNIDDQMASRFAKSTKGRIVTFGIHNKADYKGSNIQQFSDHSEFDLNHDGKTYHIKTNYLGEFNIYNLIGAITIVCENGISIEQILPYTNSIPTIEGRCTTINIGQKFNVIVDYAFTPNAAEKVVQYADSITDKDHKIIVVYGAAGNRDRFRRAPYGEIVDKYCKYIILTKDDPENERTIDICNEVKAGIKEHECLIIEDRYQAIKKAIELADEGDTVCILGKGEETFFRLNNLEREFWMGDSEAAKKAILELGKDK